MPGNQLSRWPAARVRLGVVGGALAVLLGIALTGPPGRADQNAFAPAVLAAFRAPDKLTVQVILPEPDAKEGGTLKIELRDGQGRTARLACPPVPSPLHLLLGLFGHEMLSPREKLATLRVMSAAKARADDPSLDRESVASWLGSLGQSANAQRCFWTPVCLATLNATPAESSAALFAVVLVRAFMGSGSVGVAALRLGRRFIGTDLNPEAVQLTGQRLHQLGEGTQPTVETSTSEPGLFAIMGSRR